MSDTGSVSHGTGTDLTGAVMGKLGYMRVSPRTARRRARRKVLARMAMMALVGLVSVGSIGLTRFGREHTAVPSEAGMSVPEALGHDFGRQRDRMQRTIQHIQRLLPAAPDELQDDMSLPEEVERSGMGPIDDPTWLVSNEA